MLSSEDSRVQKSDMKIYVDAKEGTNNGWFLPHFPIIRPDKSTRKVRIASDSSMKSEGKSLNDIIHPGPKLQQDLINVLLRFRRYPIALVCNIVEIHLRIGICSIDQPYQRILWRSLKRNKEPKKLQFTRDVFEINSSLFYPQFVS